MGLVSGKDAGRTRLVAAWIMRSARICVAAGTDLLNDNGLYWAGAVAYWAVLSILPLLIAGIGVASWFIDPVEVIDRGKGTLGPYLPSGGLDQLASIVRSAIASGAEAGLVSILTSLWTGSRVFDAAATALNVAYDVEEPYGFLKRNAIAVAMAATLGVFTFVALLSPVAVAALAALAPTWTGPLATALSMLVPPVLLFNAFLLVYRLVPAKRIGWRAASAGALAAAGLFLLSRPVVTLYVVRFANYNIIYGSLAILITLVLWAWIAAVILLYGGEVASHTHSVVTGRQSIYSIRPHHRPRRP